MSTVLQRVFGGALPLQDNRPFRLFWRASQNLAGLLLIQRLDVREELCGGIEGRISCLSTRIGVPLETFLGQPVTVQLVTDQGALHAICAIVTDAYEGESDGSIATYQLVIRDALSLMERRTNTRVFRTKNVVDIIKTLVHEWRRKSTTLGGTFDVDVSRLDTSKYPAREQVLQFDESDADFIRRLCRRDGIAWFIRAGGAQASNLSAQPFHTLVLFDNATKLAQASVGTVPYHADAAVGARDSITLLSTGRQVVAGSIRRVSWDLKPSRVDQVQAPTRVDQGSAGNDLAGLLSDARIDSPHMADSWADYDRIGMARLMSHGARSVRVDGASGVRDLTVGCWITVSGHPELDRLPEQQRRIVITALHHTGENNLPKDLNERAQALFGASRWQSVTAPVSVDTRERPTSFDGSSQSRYENTFSGVPYGTPLTPAYDPRIHLPKVYPITGIVTATQGEQVHCDGFGRINAQIQGMAAADHEHAGGAGTNGTPADSAFVRVLSSWAGDNFGAHMVPRAGMEVLLDFANGDPDRMYVAGVFSNGDNMPATFSRTGSLPGNRYLSGLRSREIKGERYNQLRLDDTPSQISAQLASEHASSELNLGFLTQPRDNGQGANRGEGAELRTDAAASLRAAQGILLTTYARARATGTQLDRQELIQLLGECTELFKSLGDYAGQHGGQASDTSGQTAVTDAFRTWQADGQSASDGSQALMALGAQAGSVNLTPKTHVTYAGENIDQIARNNVQVASGQRINLQAGQGLAMFAQSHGVSAVANQGKVLLQSQADDTRIDSAKNLHFTAADGKIVGMAREQITLTTSGGAYLRIDGANIELGCPGSFTVKSAGHKWSGPASMSTEMPNFDKSALGRLPAVVRPVDGQGVQGLQAEIKKASGERMKGQSSATGELAPFTTDQFEKFAAQFFENQS
ncbi:type VI secretion system tip protein VgrG [Paraburkholderia sp. D15]|uniref:type VI secretion system Vgr family protein n=1 Tax=Paraburkholderia sp. D15 TaxID=2880218 RepID=UPI00247A892E|nr:type VI secretion system Vgr family protein [Paraburkholderia sp. D15]WGS53049.1 type VI secretion system tip protein VgrG [Paraburkholderia sp. D15]